MAEEKTTKENVNKGWQPTFYDTVGVIIPGTWVIIGLFLLKVDLAPLLARGREAFGLAELGLFFLLTFAVGHLIAAIGNILEDMWWWIFELPTDKPFKKSNGLFEQVRTKMNQIQPSNEYTEISNSIDKWKVLVREAYAHVAGAGRNGRIDVFNAQYGMMRGLAAGSLVLAVVAATAEPFEWRPMALFGVAALIALYRMQRFGKSYARELFAQFLSLPVPKA